MGFKPAHSSCYSFERRFPSTIINAINDINSLEYLLEWNKIKYPEKIEYKQKTEYDVKFVDINHYQTWFVNRKCQKQILQCHLVGKETIILNLTYVEFVYAGHAMHNLVLYIFKFLHILSFHKQQLAHHKEQNKTQKINFLFTK